MHSSLSFCILGVEVMVSCPDTEVSGILMRNWGGMLAPEASPRLRYDISPLETNGYSITPLGRPSLSAHSRYDLLYEIEKDLTIALQHCRRDLYFLHAGAIESGGEAIVLVAPSGHGKSTTTWALLHHGFNYLSDELAAIDVESKLVIPFPHAVCMKQAPSTPYDLPDMIIDTGPTLHVPVDKLPSRMIKDPVPLASVLFVRFQPHAKQPLLRRVSSAEGSARLYANALNQLAHENAGIDAAVSIAESVACFTLDTSDLKTTCALVCAHFHEGKSLRA